jgi:hypothetical protein
MTIAKRKPADAPRLTIQDMVQREIQCCMSALVTTLARGDASKLNESRSTFSLADLCEQAAELASPVLDYEEAARQAGWTRSAKAVEGYFHFRKAGQRTIFKPNADAWQEICEYAGLQPYEWEVYEFWAVSAWLAAQLQALGEKVDTDFAGLNVWARTTTGQAISMDGCIERIYRDMMS